MPLQFVVNCPPLKFALPIFKLRLLVPILHAIRNNIYDAAPNSPQASIDSLQNCFNQSKNRCL